MLIRRSPPDASAEPHFVILQVVGMWVRSDVFVSARGSDVTVSIFADYSKTPLRFRSSHRLPK